MATLPPFFASGTGTGSNEKIEVKVIIWDNVGSGTFSSFSTFQAAFQGQISNIFYNGPLNLSLALTDQNPGASSGPASISVNNLSDSNAQYQVNGSQISVNANLGGKPETITFYAGGGGTYINLTGALSQSIWLGPQ